MAASVYELLASLARYWFIGLALFILFCMVLSVTREMRIERAVQDEIGEMGTGIHATLVLLSDENRRLKRGKLFAVAGETTIGRARKCDICLRAPSLKGVHCILNMEKDGLHVVPVGNAFVAVNGEEILRRGIAEDGAELQLGGLVFRLRLEETDE